MKLYVRFMVVGFLLGAFAGLYSQLNSAQLPSNAVASATAANSGWVDGGYGAAISAFIFGILGTAFGLVGAFLTRLLLSFRNL